jgi:hypothetical protein
LQNFIIGLKNYLNYNILKFYEKFIFGFFLGVAGMPKRIPDYPDDYFVFNQIASFVSYISVLSTLFFVLVVLESFGLFKSIKLSKMIFSNILYLIIVPTLLSLTGIIGLI